MMTRPLGKTGFSIAPLVFGGNVSRRFKQTADLCTSDQVAATAERKN